MRTRIVKMMREMRHEMMAPDPVTPLHYAYVERFGHPPGASFIECRGLDRRGFPKFRVQADRRDAE